VEAIVAHIPKDDVQTLWKETQDHNWTALEQTLKGHQNKAGGIDDKMVDILISVSQMMADSNKPFPDSVDELYNTLNRQVQGKQIGKGPG
jgi:hypothetical protein